MVTRPLGVTVAVHLVLKAAISRTPYRQPADTGLRYRRALRYWGSNACPSNS